MNVISQGEYKIPIGKREISLEEFNAQWATTAHWATRPEQLPQAVI